MTAPDMHGYDDRDDDLVTAFTAWNDGLPCPVDVAMRLVGKGYDIQQMEDTYQKC